MKLEMLKELLENKIKNIQCKIETSRLTGDIEGIIMLENELSETINTLDKLKLLE
jgi:hypothetical protein